MDEDLHRSHGKHECHSQLLPQRQLQLRDFKDRHDDQDGVDENVCETVDENGVDEIDALSRLLVLPAKPREAGGQATERIHKSPGDADSHIHTDESVGDVAESTRLEDAQQEETDGDLGERDLDFVHHSKGLEQLVECGDGV